MAGSRPVVPGPQDPPDGRFAEVVTEPGQLAMHPAISPAGFSCASRSTRSRISWLVPGRPGRFGYVHLSVIRRRCQANKVPGVTSRWERNAAGSSRASAARTVRSAQSGFGWATWRRNTVTSCRSLMISASLDAWPRPSRSSRPKTRIMIRHRRRRDTNRDPALTRSSDQTAVHSLNVEFWSGTGSGRPSCLGGSCTSTC